MNANKIKYKKVKATDAENSLKRKHDETKALMNQLNQKALTEAELEKQRAKQRRLAKIAAMQKLQ